MQRFVNHADFIVEDMMKGIEKARPELEILSENDHVMKLKAAPIASKVGLVSGGGSGHEPAFLGYVGHQMLDAVAVGEVFSSPPAQAFYDAFMSVDSGNGVACLFGNYAGDNMNVKMAVDMCLDEGVEVKYVVATDDVSSSPKETKEKRHGIAGGVFMWKVAGAKASQGATLDEVIRVAQKTVNQTRSICVGLSSCTIPAVGKPNFHIDEGKMEFGIGHHGEPGMHVEDLKSAKDIAKDMVKAVVDDLEVKADETLSVIVSGLGATPIMELYVLYNDIESELQARNINIDKVLVGNYVTSLDMNGAALTIMRMDDELHELLEVEADSMGLRV
ncbi:dihydroxyacetone kinase DhaK subunit [Breznakia blatticola]|uniref:Dihydroxyacetone kinase DhaK subunit n=1 Tax=Breznakia blatticola TaxID=1754012 RepID=A0A4R7ZGM0_9FIRM|nr:dihydroxyacetone kinase subunit DhaK [Breznakia blatticola]TDW16196.1 dihydroxyacetone kinase DhaK subunit [Breznakia blatticola]